MRHVNLVISGFGVFAVEYVSKLCLFLWLKLFLIRQCDFQVDFGHFFFNHYLVRSNIRVGVKKYVFEEISSGLVDWHQKTSTAKYFSDIFAKIFWVFLRYLQSILRKFQSPDIPNSRNFKNQNSGK